LEQPVEHAQASGAKRTTEVERLRAAMVAKRRAVVAAMPGLFDQGELGAIKELLMSARYMDRYVEQCDAVLDED
jgi:hypothetical protein